jgi:hypothetical protein
VSIKNLHAIATERGATLVITPQFIAQSEVWVFSTLLRHTTTDVSNGNQIGITPLDADGTALAAEVTALKANTASWVFLSVATLPLPAGTAKLQLHIANNFNSGTVFSDMRLDRAALSCVNNTTGFLVSAVPNIVDGTNLLASFGAVQSSVGGSCVLGANYQNAITVFGAASGSSPLITTAGIDTNIDLTLTPKGTGLLCAGYSSTAAAVPANFSAARYLPIKDSSGTTYYVPLASAVW